MKMMIRWQTYHAYLFHIQTLSKSMCKYKQNTKYRATLSCGIPQNIIEGTKNPNSLRLSDTYTIIWTSAGISLIGPLKANFSDILIEIQTFWFKKIRLKMLSVKCCPLRLGLNVLNQTAPPSLNSPWSFTYSGVKGESQPYSQRCSGVRDTKNPFYGHRLISISAWMSTYINYTVWDENIHSQCLSTAQLLKFGNW